MNSSKIKAFKVNATDNLMVALQDLIKGETLEESDGPLLVLNSIDAKHKIAAKEIKKGEKAFMYGVLVGEATQTICRGEKITTSNLVHRSADYKYESQTDKWKAPSVDRWEDKNFLGYQRSDGSAGTANYWLVVPLVFCENGNIEILKRSMIKALGFDKRSQYESFAEELANAYQNGDSPEKVLLPEENANRPSPIFPNIDGIKF